MIKHPFSVKPKNRGYHDKGHSGGNKLKRETVKKKHRCFFFFGVFICDGVVTF